MSELLSQWDAQWFQLINSGCANALFDSLMPLLRNKFFWSPLYIFILVFLLLNYKQHALKIILLAIITIFISDQLSSSFFKPLFQRARPCHGLNEQLEYVRLLVNCGSGFSMPSSHAANHFAFATFFFMVFRTRRVFFYAFLWAAVIGFAQIYVGVHYPLDIVAGALLGVIVGWLTGRWCGI